MAPTVLAGRVQGTVVQMDEKTFLISPKGAAPLSVSRDSVTRVELHTGRRRNTLAGMGIGAGLGALVMGISPPVNEGHAKGFSGETALIGALVGGIEGAVVGAIVKTDRWTTVPVSQVQITLAPTRGHGASLSMSIRF